MMATHDVVSKFVDLSYGTPGQQSSSNQVDHLQAYACEVLTLGFLLMEFSDAIREGDSFRIL